MRKFFLITIFSLTVIFQASCQTEFSVSCDDTWGPGRYNKVSITINVSGSPDFARFTQDFPVGLEAVKDNPGSGDFSYVENQLNVVWMKLPENRVLTFSYFVNPDKQMNGNFSLTGKLLTISDGSVQRTSVMKEKPITIEGINGILPEQMKVVPVAKNTSVPVKEPAAKSVGKNEKILFRVQVSVSSVKTNEGEFRKKLGAGTDIKVNIIQSGKIYKYQAGEFSSYNSANEMMKRIVAGGFKDAFIVAFKGTEQIPVSEALDAQK